jgi:hypothetical protein
VRVEVLAAQVVRAQVRPELVQQRDAVGMSSPAICSSGIDSRCLTRARSVLPCETTSTQPPSSRSGTIASYQYGSSRAETSRRDSARGCASGGSMA